MNFEEQQEDLLSNSNTHIGAQSPSPIQEGPVPDLCLAPAPHSVHQDEAGPAQSPLITR